MDVCHGCKNAVTLKLHSQSISLSFSFDMNGKLFTPLVFSSLSSISLNYLIQLGHV